MKDQKCDICQTPNPDKGRAFDGRRAEELNRNTKGKKLANLENSILALKNEL